MEPGIKSDEGLKTALFQNFYLMNLNQLSSYNKILLQSWNWRITSQFYKRLTRNIHETLFRASDKSQQGAKLGKTRHVFCHFVTETQVLTLIWILIRVFLTGKLAYWMKNYHFDFPQFPWVLHLNKLSLADLCLSK